METKTKNVPANVKADKNAGNGKTYRDVADKSEISNVYGKGTEQQGIDHNAVINRAADNENNRQKEVHRDKKMNAIDNKLRDQEHGIKISDSSELKQLKDDAEIVKAMIALPSDERTGEFSTVIGFYYKRMNENIKKL